MCTMANLLYFVMLKLIQQLLDISCYSSKGAVAGCAQHCALRCLRLKVIDTMDKKLSGSVV